MFDQISVTGRGSLEIRLWSLIIGDEEVDQVNNMQSAPDYRPVNFDLNKRGTIKSNIYLTESLGCSPKSFKEGTPNLMT